MLSNDWSKVVLGVWLCKKTNTTRVYGVVGLWVRVCVWGVWGVGVCVGIVRKGWVHTRGVCMYVWAVFSRCCIFKLLFSVILVSKTARIFKLE